MNSAVQEGTPGSEQLFERSPRVGNAPSQMIEIEQVLELLPHRFPFLLVDRIVEIERGVRIIGLKNVTANEPLFATDDGHGGAMPGLLIVEAMAQTGAVLLMTEQGTAVPKIVYFASLDHVSWPGTVRAGDQLRLEVTVTQARGRLHKVHATASVQGATVCEADLAAVVVETPR